MTASVCSPDTSCPAAPALPVPLDIDRLATLCKALAHPARLQLVRHLAAHGTCYFGNLSDVVGLAPSTTSQHVKVLKEAGLVLGSAQEQRTCYCIDPARLAELKALIQAL
jgi:ArsR family transcriptional regulator